LSGGIPVVPGCLLFYSDGILFATNSVTAKKPCEPYLIAVRYLYE
jgi:hypothetical protein